MGKRSSILAALAAATALAAPAPSAWASPASASNATAFSFRGMNLKLPSGWKVHRDGDRIVVATGKCATPAPFAPDCRGFWIFGPKAFTKVPVGGGSFTYTGKQQFYPFSGLTTCPFSSKTAWSPGEKAASTGLRAVGRGHRATHTAWPTTCVTHNGGRHTASFTQREWFLPTSKILVVDVWSTRQLPSVLKNATWSRPPSPRDIGTRDRPGAR
ncbi:hypothetical protein GCM10010156_30970 [Planobispora rosea]|uniref:Secreted protein n=1 Tax=Planobispora rosea TaxID=35762 RepID=A0A8J3RXN3_PLARO|nr:hypothetical protein [Planobispora rosea]GGS69999.1 hypothetical protein GCM10010156_30970 [Planobispora rosea]GIH83205.1 hypothetical protein Pro02_16130 [Planobispora rosea]